MVTARLPEISSKFTPTKVEFEVSEFLVKISEKASHKEETLCVEGTFLNSIRDRIESASL